MIKKSLIFLFCIVFFQSFVLAQEYKIEVSTLQETFEAGENITLRVSLFDSANNPVNDEVLVVLEDAEKNIKIEKTVQSNAFVEVSIEKGASYGQGTITAKYKDTEAIGYFVIEIKELVEFEIIDNNLRITNIGNTKYTKTIQITIGKTTGTKSPKIDVGKSVSYRLVAPNGIYNIKVTDGKTTLTQSEVQLTGTGNAIGVFDEAPSQRSGITGINPEENSEGVLSSLKGSKFIYVFVLVIFGATILLAIERMYKRKAKE